MVASLAVLRATPMVSPDAATWRAARSQYRAATTGAAGATEATVRLRERPNYSVYYGSSRDPRRWAILCQGGDGTFDMINKRLIYAKPSRVVTPKSACNNFLPNSKPLGASNINMDCTQVA